MSTRRDLHPGAWWLWGLGLAVAASRTSQPLLLLLVLAVVALVVARRRTDAPWARGVRGYVLLAVAVIGIRVVFRAVFGGSIGDTVLFTLPSLQLPDVAAGITVGGPVTLEGVLAAAYDGLRLATLLLCIGAVNLLANPKRLLKSTPGALHEVGTAVVVSLSVASNLVAAVRRVRAARRLRGQPRRGLRGSASLLLPVLEDALERSLALAAAMDARGYGRARVDVPRADRAASGALLLAGALGLLVGAYGLLDGTTPPVLGAPVLLLGTALAVVGLRRGGRAVVRTVHRPSPWTAREWGVAASGGVAALVLVVVGRTDPAVLTPALVEPAWPTLPPLPAAGVLAAAAAGWIAPEPARAPRTRGTGASRRAAVAS